MATVHQLKKAEGSDLGRAIGSRIPAGPLVVLGLAFALAGLAFTMERATYNIWGAFWIGPVLVLLCVPLANHASKVTGDLRFGRLIMTAAFVKVIGASLARYWVDFSVYGGSDATEYHDGGVILAPLLRSGIYDELGKLSGTRFTEVVTGHVYALIGPSRLGGFMVFSWLAFIGLFLFWRAFCVGVPNGDHRRYALLAFFFPTILIWTSGTGKDAWMMLCLGGTAWGFASLLTGRWRVLPVLGLALWGAAIVRPHLVLIILIAAAAGVLVRLLPAQESQHHARRGSRALLIGVLTVATVLTVGQAEQYFGLDDLDVESAREVTDRVVTNTALSGSTFEAPDPGTPVGYLRAGVTVLFRPFPLEVPTAQGTATAAEGVALLLLLYFSARRLARLPAALLKIPYMAFAMTYVIAFVYAFASIGNFGILARQRAQLLPMIFVLVSLGVSRAVSADGSQATGLAHLVEDGQAGSTMTSRGS